MSESKQPIKIQGPPIKGGEVGRLSLGFGRVKLHHFWNMASAAWENKDNLAYAMNILQHGVCDECSIGHRGLNDTVVKGTELCLSRLKFLRNNTIGSFSEADVCDIKRLRKMSDRELRLLGRIPYPFVYRSGDRGFNRLTWDQAFQVIGENLAGISSEKQAYFASSKGITNETYYAFTKTARLMGTNNVDFCDSNYDSATGAGLLSTIGVGASTISLTDLIGTDLILLWGSSSEKNQSVSEKYLHLAKNAGTRIVSIDTSGENRLGSDPFPSIPQSAPLGSKLADDIVRVKFGGELALINAIMKLLIEWEAFNEEYIDAHTEGWPELVESVQGFSLEQLSERSGVSVQQIDWLATTIARATTMVTAYSIGFTQHKFGSQNVIGVVNLHLAKGAFGKKQSGILPFRVSSGEQGGGECGVTPTKYPGGFNVNQENAARFSEIWGHEVPHSTGMSTIPMMEAAHRGEIEFLYNLGGDLERSTPDPGLIQEAFSKIKLRIYQGTNLNSSMLLEPGEVLVVLPTQTCYEQQGGGTVTNTERRICFSPEIKGHPVVGEAKVEWAIPGLIACSVRPELEPALCFSSSQSIRDEMAKVMPIYSRINELTKDGDQWQWGGAQLCSDGDFSNMPNNRARFHVLQLSDIEKNVVDIKCGV
jgi:molybdopterin-dependent oxidoreductase alpha subunit